MNYQITITLADNKKVELGTKEEVNEEIRGFSFKMNSLDDNAKERDKNARCEMKLRGLINDNNREMTKILADWSLKTKNLFATVEVEVSTSNNTEEKNVLRRYVFDKMFCVDYIESFDDYRPVNENGEAYEGEAGIFELFMAQSPTHTEPAILIS